MFSVIQTRTGSFFHNRHSILWFLCISVKLVNTQDHEKTSNPSTEIVSMKITFVICHLLCTNGIKKRYLKRNLLLTVDT